MLQWALQKIIGTKNERELKKLRPLVAHINSLEPEVQKLSDEQLRAKTAEFRQRLDQGATLDDLLPEAFAVVREAARRTLGERHFDVQVMGAIVLHQGKIAEMKTGEGKTLTSTMPVYLNALTGRGVHVVTTNEYLAQRDADWMGSIYKFLGLSVGVTLEGMPLDQKKKAYLCDVTYGTNSEFGFDYLRDNSTARHRDERVQRGHYYAIVDEVDSILIDEARTPHIISQPRQEKFDYIRIARVVERMKRDEHFEVDEERSKRGHVSLTDKGIDFLEREFGVSNLYAPENIDLLHHIMKALEAHAVWHRDVDYIVQDGRVILVDEFTGRLQPERRLSDGLHQAIEAKERVPVVEESQTVARITFQNYFRLYEKLAGMTGTAATEAEEFYQIYGLDVVVIPTHKPMIREDLPDLVFRDKKSKMRAVIRDIEENYKKGRPVLVGTVSIEASEEYSRELTKRGIPHRVLNAKEHAKEAEIIAQAGQPYAVTIATNMAGRGVDIKLGPGVAELGGLHVIGTERHDSRRIDNQLRGRSGRQGDPGSSRFYLSLEDDLMRRFGSERIQRMMDRLGMEPDVPIEHKMVTRAIEKAQERVEQMHFDIRKQILKYDNVLSEQREVIYRLRNRILDEDNLRDEVLDMVESAIEAKIDEFLPEEEPDAWNPTELVNWVQRNCGVDISDWAEAMADMEVEEIRQRLLDAFHQAYDAREKELGSELMRQLERLVLLDRIDYHWMEHLHNIDYIQEGIGFRGYAGKDPVVEFQREAFELFESMLARIYEDVAQYIFRVQVQFVPSSTPTDVRASAAAEEKASRRRSTQAAGPAALARRARQREFAGVGRNDPCPCGSGKKFKHCHGRRV